jgi:hypothetical protein
MDETKLNKDLSRANEARRIIENPLVMEALSLIRSNLHSKWEASSYEESTGREEAYRMLKVANEFERYFHQALESGKIAEKELSLMEKVKQKFKVV